MSGGSRGRKPRWVGGVLLLVALAFLLARVIPGDGGGDEAPPVEADLPTHEAADAGDHVGQLARVCGTVESASWAREIGGRPTFLNLGRPYPDQLFTVVIWGEDRARFDAPPERRWAGRRICVAGRITTHEGTPRIVVRRPEQIGARGAVTGGDPGSSRGVTP